MFYWGRDQTNSVSFTHSEKLPFHKLSLAISFDYAPQTSFWIGKETRFSTLLDTPIFDRHYLVKSNQPSILRQFLSNEVIKNFRKLYHIGDCSWHYKPLSKKMISFKSSEQIEDETVLDAPEVTDKESLALKTDQNKANLVIDCQLNAYYEYDLKVIEKFVAHSYEITVSLMKLLEQEG